MPTAPLATVLAPEIASHLQKVLINCVDFGEQLAQLAVTQATAATLPVDKASIAYHRTTRSIRLSVWLIRKLAEPAKSVDRVAARKRILRVLQDNIQRHADDAEATDDAETLNEELRERLETEDLEDEIGDRTVEDIITDIIRDLGLAAVPGNHPWKRRTPADIAELVAHAAQPVPATQRAATPTPARDAPVWPSQTHHRAEGCNSS